MTPVRIPLAWRWLTERRRADERELLPVGCLAALPGCLDPPGLHDLGPSILGESDLSPDQRPAGPDVPEREQAEGVPATREAPGGRRGRLSWARVRPPVQAEHEHRRPARAHKASHRRLCHVRRGQLSHHSLLSRRRTPRVPRRLHQASRPPKGHVHGRGAHLRPAFRHRRRSREQPARKHAFRQRLQVAPHGQDCTQVGTRSPGPVFRNDA